MKKIQKLATNTLNKFSQSFQFPFGKTFLGIDVWRVSTSFYFFVESLIPLCCDNKLHYGIDGKKGLVSLTQLGLMQTVLSVGSFGGSPKYR